MLDMQKVTGSRPVSPTSFPATEGRPGMGRGTYGFKMRKTLEAINELKKEKLIKDYAIGGAIGVLKWVEPFFTQDLDIFIILVTETKEKELVDLSPIYEYLKKKGCLRSEERRVGKE